MRAGTQYHLEHIRLLQSNPSKDRNVQTCDVWLAWKQPTNAGPRRRSGAPDTTVAAATAREDLSEAKRLEPYVNIILSGLKGTVKKHAVYKERA